MADRHFNDTVQDLSGDAPFWCHYMFSLLGPKALIRRCDDLPATITHVPVAAVLVLNTPEDGRLRPKHVD